MKLFHPLNLKISQSRSAMWFCCALLLVWLLAPTILVVSLSSWDGGAVRAVGAVGFAACIFIFPVVFLVQIRRMFIFWLPVGFLVPLQCYLIHLFRSVPGDAFTHSLLRTSPIEIRETLSGFGWLPLLLPVIWLAYLSLLHPLKAAPGLSPRQRKGLLAVLLLYGWLAAASYDPEVGEARALPELLSPQTVNASFPLGPLLSLYRVMAMAYREQGIATHSLHPRAPAAPQLMILVIGETLRADHLGVNGYFRPTTPELAKLGPDLLTFSNMATTANYTALAVPRIIQQDLPQGKATLVNAFRESGFTTAWLSNQDIGLEPSDAHLVDVTQTDWKQGKRYDTVLLPKLAACLRQCGDRQFIVLHILGSHFPYDLRYPPERQVFSPSFSAARGQTVSLRYKQELINAYDNSIVETDRFLSNVITQAQHSGKPAIVMFTADHGENLYDDQRRLVLHSGLHPSRAEAFVPLLIWASPSYRAAHPQTMAVLASNRAAPVSHLNIMPTMLDLANVRYEKEDSSKSLASPTFTPRQRLIDGTGAAVNVDTLK